MTKVVPHEESTGNPSEDLHEADAEGWIAYDDVTGTWLDPAMVVAARRDEIEYFKSRGVYKKVGVEESWKETGKAPIAVRWIDINKGDALRPEYRSRLVAEEFKTDERPELYAATPPSECLRMLLSKLASSKKVKLMYADVSRAYFYAKAARPVYVQLTDEDKGPGDEGMCGRLVMSMYGTRDAAVNWAAEYSETLRKEGFVQGKSNPCLFWHARKDVSIMVHGDDFVAVGEEKHLTDTRKALEDKYKLKVETLGDGSKDKKEIRILNKVVRYTSKGIELEADPRHAEIVIKELGLKNAKANKVPGSKAVVSRKTKMEEQMPEEVRVLLEEEHAAGERVSQQLDTLLVVSAQGAEEEQKREEGHDEDGKAEDDEALGPAEARRYRAITARLNYMSPDRVDIQFAVKEAARAMSQPRKSSWSLLSKIGRYLVGRPRLVMEFPWQTEQGFVTTYTDSDWAGCAKTARSTSGGIVTIGDHVIKSYSRQQKTVALSSAEAELYAMVAASAETLAVIAYAKDLGLKMEGEIYTDSSAALGISQRTGIGKVRHLKTQGLWIQEVRTTGRLSYKKVLGEKNPADVLAKHVPAELLDKHLATLYTKTREGRAETAPELSSVESCVRWVEEEVDEKSVAEKRVRFSMKVQIRAIPHENKGRKCSKNKEGEHETKGELSRGGEGHKERRKQSRRQCERKDRGNRPLCKDFKALYEESKRKSWASLAEEEEEERKRKREEQRKPKSGEQ